jgi:hypothetical protein
MSRVGWYKFTVVSKERIDSLFRVEDKKRELLRLRHRGQGRGFANDPLGYGVGWRGLSVQVKIAR